MSGFEAHVFEGTGEIVKLVVGSEFYLIYSLLVETGFIRLDEWEAYGWFDDGCFNIYKCGITKGVIVVSLS